MTPQCRPRLVAALVLLCSLYAARSEASRLTAAVESLLGGRQAQAADSGEAGEVWALLIAGSSGWGNYRHQADVCHAYQVLRRGGVPDDHIVVMMADDLATSVDNPYPGQLFNRPGGADVYAGVPKDYTGANVNAETFLAVLEGRADQPAIIGTSGKAIKSGPNDRVFVFYSDHGAPGVVGMPSGPFLYADQLLKALHSKAARGGFKDMVMYIEACESGSMFDGLLTDDLNIYVTTASNAHESSWGTYCPGMAVPAPPEFSTCLGDLYSVAWMENSDEADLGEESLEKQFELVRRRTSNNYTYSQGSHAMQYGSLAIDEEPAADYLGAGNSGGGRKPAARLLEAPPAPQGAVAQRDADLLHLWTAYLRAAPSPAKEAALLKLNAELVSRARVDGAMRSAVAGLLSQGRVLAAFQAAHASQSELLAALPAPGAGEVQPLAQRVVDVALPRPAGAPLVDDWDCLRAMVAAWEGACGPLDQYGMRHTRAFANLCNSGVAAEWLGQAAHDACQPPALVAAA